MKKRLIALLLIIALLLPASMASAATWYRVNTSSLNVRYLPSESAKVLGSYRRDYALNIQSTKDGWSYVVFSNGFEGYVQTKYLSKGSSYSAWIYKDETALRKGPDGSFAATAYLAKGTKVTVLTHGSKYDYVSAGSFGRGYVVNSLLSKTKIKKSGSESTSTSVSGGDYYAWVLNAGSRKVNLRSKPSTNAAVITQYPTGTKVYVISHGSTWDKVKVDGNTGYMMTQYLITSEPAPTPIPTKKPSQDSYTAYVVTANKKSVHVRKGQSTNYTVLFNVPYGAAVEVLKHGSSWDYIEYNGKKGYVMNKFLQLNKPKDAPEDPDPEVTKKPEKKFEPYYATVNINDLNFHKQKGDWSSNVDGVGRLQKGQVVKVLAISGTWAKVQYNGKTGWVHKKYLD